MTYGQNPPAIDKLSFECPHCGAYTSQTWWHVGADKLGTNKVPRFPSEQSRKNVNSSKDLDDQEKKRLNRYIDRMSTGKSFLQNDGQASMFTNFLVHNLHISECYTCSEISFWLHTTLLWPTAKTAPKPNSDMPATIAAHFEEARDIFDRSARGAAAMLRLCVQELCDHLGHKGKKIDDAIAAMVRDGLPPVIQQALDTVRVVGNEAVHPGKISFDDDREAAAQLFNLVNIIVERMISHPKQIDAIYATLPESKRAAIEKRDGKAKETSH